MANWEEMEVVEVETDNELPNLSCLKQSVKDEPAWLSQNSISSYHSPPSGSFSANCSPAIWLVKEPLALPGNQKLREQQQMQGISQVQLQRHQQTTQPMCPPNEDSPPPLAAYPDAEHCPPSIAEFDNIPLQLLSSDDVAQVLCPQQQQQSQEVPSVPEIFDFNGPSQLHLGLPAVLEPQPQPHLLILDHRSRPRQNSETITLFSNRENPSPPSSISGNFEAENVQILIDLMDDGVFDDDEPAHALPNFADSLIPIPSACKATSQEKSIYEQTANYILEVHSTKSRDVPHAKKKPMLHEFLGYILFESDVDHLACLKGSVYFCRDSGDRIASMCSTEKKFFRVANFQAVSEVWRLVKSNSSADCIKNMKRAMRMSTTNDRKFFVSLSPRLHRMQIFCFGDRSLEFFKKAFPEYSSQ